MRITLLELLAGTPRLQRRIEAELAQLPQDIAAVRDGGRHLRRGIASKVTSLPALAIALVSGFAIGKIARAPRWQPNIGALTSTLWWQLLTPLASGWLQAKFAQDSPEQASEAAAPESSLSESSPPD